MLPFSPCESSTQTRSLGHRQHGHRSPTNRAPTVTRCSDLAPGEGGSCSGTVAVLAPQVHTPEAERAWSRRDGHNSEKAGKSGGSVSRHGFEFQSFWEQGDFCVLQKRMAWSWIVLPFPKLSNLLMKTFFLPHQLWCCACV